MKLDMKWHEVVCDRTGLPREKKFCPKNWKNGPKMGQKQSFLKILKNLVTDFH